MRPKFFSFLNLQDQSRPGTGNQVVDGTQSSQSAMSAGVRV